MDFISQQFEVRRDLLGRDATGSIVVAFIENYDTGFIRNDDAIRLVEDVDHLGPSEAAIDGWQIGEKFL